MILSNSTRFQRLLAGAAMVVAPLVLVLAELLHARFETDAEKQVEGVADNLSRWYAAHALVLLGLVAVVPAFFWLAQLAGRRRPALANASLVTFVPGLVALSALVGMELVLWQMAQPARNRTEMVALAERVNESAGVALVFLVALLFPVAWLLLGVGLYLARAVAAWAAVLIAIAQPIGFVGELAGGPKALAVGAQAAFAIGLVSVGLRVLRRPGEEREDVARGPEPAAT